MILNFFSPFSRILESVPVREVNLPTKLGTIQVLEGHADLITALGIGVFVIVQKDGIVVKGALAYGYAEVSGNASVNVYADLAELASGIDGDRALKANLLATEKLTQAVLDDSAFQKYEHKLQRSLARLGSLS